MTRYTIDDHGMLHLPDGLSVGGDLDLRGTAITALPEDIVLCGARIADAPVIPDIHKAVYDAASQPDALEMSDWHCGTAHCRAGWAITLAGEAGRTLEEKIGTANAAYLIYAASDPARPVPDFYCGNDTALDDMRRMAETEEVRNRPGRA